jgi:hypothetical protein
VVVVVEVAHGPVAPQVVQVLRQLVDEVVALLDHWWQHGVPEADEGPDDHEEHDGDSRAATEATGDHPLHGRAQPDREEQRDHDEDDDAACLDHGLHEEVRDEDPERSEETDHERRVAPDRSPEPAELRVRGVRADLLLERLGLGLGVLGPGLGAFSPSLGAFGPGLGAFGPRFRAFGPVRGVLGRPPRRGHP